MLSGNINKCKVGAICPPIWKYMWQFWKWSSYQSARHSQPQWEVFHISCPHWEGDPSLGGNRGVLLFPITLLYVLLWRNNQRLTALVFGDTGITSPSSWRWGTGSWGSSPPVPPNSQGWSPTSPRVESYWTTTCPAYYWNFSHVCPWWECLR